MRDTLLWLVFFALVAFPAIAYANPVSPTDVPPDPSLLGAILMEIIVVCALLWKQKLRLAVFFPCWYALNLLSFYVLLPGFSNLIYVLHFYDKLSENVYFPVTLVATMMFVILVEGATLYGMTRLPVFGTSQSKPVSWSRAILASFLGNLTSAVTYPLIRLLT